MSFDRRSVAPVDLDRLAQRLRSALGDDGTVRFDPASRHLYATDASNYRQVPLGVVVPRDVDQLVVAVTTCVDAGAPVLVRGAGTSQAGQATNAAVVVDTRRLDALLGLDPRTRTARVEPGVVLSSLQRAAAPHGLGFGPDPSTANRCTIGGMVANNACGVHSVTAGRTSDNVVSLDVLLTDGTRFTARRLDADGLATAIAAGGRVGMLHRELRDVARRAAPLVRERFPAIPRRVSGTNLDELVPVLDGGAFDVARLLVGTEGTHAVVLGAELALVPTPPFTALAALGFPDLATAADAVPSLLARGPRGLEAIDRHIARSAGRDRELLPPGDGWLLLEFGGPTAEDAAAAARACVAAHGTHGSGTVVTDPIAQAALWRVRADGLGAIVFSGDGPPRTVGWEDAAVAPERLGEYLRALDVLLDEHGLDRGVYGHFGDGCVHAKIGFDLVTAAGRRRLRSFVEAAADLTVSLGGSLSGEHGDGQARGELLARMYGEELVAAFRAVRTLFDPTGLLNPGKGVDARPLDADLRPAGFRPHTPEQFLPFAADGGRFATAVDRCVGMGVCLRDDDVATMCPSYRVTHDEQHSTRGRARLLHEMLRGDGGHDVAAGPGLERWRDPAVDEALELCLSCKACARECPTGVDMAALKSEVRFQRWRGRVRPAEHLVLGLAHVGLRLGSRAPTTTNRLAGSRASRAVRRRVGLTTAVAPPLLAAQRWSTSLPRGPLGTHLHAPAPADPPDDGTDAAGTDAAPGDGPPPPAPVVLFADTFTDTLRPAALDAAARLLTAAGREVAVVNGPCCGRPLFDVGMLRLARWQLRRLLARLGPLATAGIPLVVLEPSCRSVLGDELPAMFPDDPAAHALSDAVTSIGGFALEVADRAGRDRAAGWRAGDGRPPDRAAPRASGPASPRRDIVVHPHCHVATGDAGAATDVAALATVGHVDVLDAGCCGMAGGFGFGADRHDVAVRIARSRLVPAIAARPDADVVADGMSCRLQIADQAARHARHAAELLADHLLGPTPRP